MNAAEKVSLVQILGDHWIHALVCHEDTHADTSHCACGKFNSEPMPNVGAAVRAWAMHVVSVLDDQPAGEVEYPAYMGMPREVKSVHKARLRKVPPAGERAG